MEVDTLVVGAGPQALTVLARWLCDRPAAVRDVMVVDPAGEWLSAWRAGFACQEIDVLRSPGVHHPDPDDMAYIHSCPPRALAEVSSGAPTVRAAAASAVGPLRRPTTAAFWHFCEDLLRRTRLADHVVQATVDGLQASHHDRWVACLSNGVNVRARQVVWAGNPRVPRWPRGVELGGSVVHGDAVDLSTVGVGERIAVIGAGQTAGQLALRAAERGAAVTLVGRGPRRIADLDVDAGWLMDDHLAPLRAIRDPVDRRRVVEAAQRGSMTADLDRALRRAGVARVVEVGEIVARSSGSGAAVGFAGAEYPVDRVWSATGSVADLRKSPVLAALALDGAPHVDGWPVLDRELRWLDGLVVVGALAALTLGPAAGNLGGARAAADLLADATPGCSRRRAAVQE